MCYHIKQPNRDASNHGCPCAETLRVNSTSIIYQLGLLTQILLDSIDQVKTRILIAMWRLVTLVLLYVKASKAQESSNLFLHSVLPGLVTVLSIKSNDVSPVTRDLYAIFELGCLARGDVR